MGKRRKARELVLQGLYAWEMNRDRFEAIVETFNNGIPDDPDTVEFASALFRKAVRQQEELDRDIRSVVKNWDFDRLALLDRLILRLAVAELLYFSEIPPKVTINEAIDLAKKFSTEQSGQFVNGILDALYKQYHQEKRILKSGRGLIE
jgi:transcription antitermination protein NusB